MAEKYRPGFVPGGESRRKVGDVDVQARAAFKRQFEGLKKPISPRASQPAKPPLTGPVEPTTYRTETGRVRTRKERIDYEVDRAVKGD